MKNNTRRLKFSEDTLEFHRAYFPDLSLQKFIDNCIENEKRRKFKKRLITPF